MSRLTKGADSKHRILEAAIALIAEKGFRDTKISDIVQAAGLTQAAFYLYFPSKEAIFQEILERFYLKLEKHLQAAVMPFTMKSEDFPRRVKVNIGEVFELFQENPQLTRIFLTEERSMNDVENLIQEIIANNLILNQNAGFIRQDLSPQMMAHCLMGMFIQVTLKELLDKQRQPDDVAHEFTEILLFGLAQKRSGVGFPL